MTRAALYLLVDDSTHNVIDEFARQQDALDALDALIAHDPVASDECFVVAVDERGRRVGEPITRGVTVGR